MVQVLNRVAKTASGGFAVVGDVSKDGGKLEDEQPPLFFSGTLKFLYLTFAGPETLPLDKWVFNSAGHAFPVLAKK